MMFRAAIFVAVIIIVLMLGLFAFRATCPDNYVWVMSDAKWICVRKD